jgi:hypothetical protein
VQPHPQTTERESVAQETIVAISTPPGRGGIGIVRLSGPHALEIANGLIRTGGALEPARARLAEVADPDTSAKLDEAMVTYFARPHSYTGEDLVEIAAHGSPVILDMLVRVALRGGARLARPGEFTERAFLAGASGSDPGGSGAGSDRSGRLSTRPASRQSRWAEGFRGACIRRNRIWWS